MKLHFFSIILLSFCLTSQNVVGQIIHKNDLENFIGVLKTTPVNKPDTWPKDSLFYSSLPLENHFTHYAIGSTYKEMTEQYPYDWNTNETYSIAFWPNSRLVRSLEVLEKDWMLVAFHNGGYESGASFLTLWEVQGDSLSFRYVFSDPFITGIGSAQLEQNYIIDVYQNLIFVVKDSFGDGGKSWGSYHFIALDEENNLLHLLEKKFRSNSRSESYILYKFLWKEDLLIQRYEFSKSLYFEKFDGRKYQLTDRILESSNHELIDLIELVKNARSQK